MNKKNFYWTEIMKICVCHLTIKSAGCLHSHTYNHCIPLSSCQYFRKSNCHPQYKPVHNSYGSQTVSVTQPSYAEEEFRSVFLFFSSCP